MSKFLTKKEVKEIVEFFNLSIKDFQEGYTDHWHLEYKRPGTIKMVDILPTRYSNVIHVTFHCTDQDRAYLFKEFAMIAHHWCYGEPIHKKEELDELIEKVASISII